MPAYNNSTRRFEFTPEEIKEMYERTRNYYGVPFGNFNVGSADMPSGLYYTGAVGDPIDEGLMAREAARQRMAQRAAEADRNRISARWDNIMVQLLHGVTERSRATGVSHYVNGLGETVDQFGRPLKAA